ncbi:MAG TPA: hypothetical protein VK186_28415 [Candidatus Deferrimicrobium sp.]|nr:hypothetical protein [Candidatus Deferrimicrobium sp.]
MKIKIKIENMNQIAAISLFWGSLWGIAEATLGYLIHLAKFFPGLAGFVMFPIGFYFMNRAYRESGKTISLFSTSAAAATIKLVDLFLPGLSPIATINPALAILMEGAVVMAIYRVVQKKQQVFGFRELLMAAVGWRAVFVFYSFVLMVLSISADFFHKGIGYFLRYFFLNPLANAVFIAIYLKISKALERNRVSAFAGGLSFSCVLFAAVIFVKMILVRFFPVFSVG